MHQNPNIRISAHAKIRTFSCLVFKWFGFRVFGTSHFGSKRSDFRQCLKSERFSSVYFCFIKFEIYFFVIFQNLLYVRCKNLKILPRKSSHFFKVIIHLKSADELNLAPKLVSGNDLVISGPWLNLENSNFSEEEIIMNFEHIQVYDNFLTLENSEFADEILMKRNCECKRNGSNKSKVLSRSKKALF